MRNRYNPRAPRTVLRLVAAALTATTLGLLVALPAKFAVDDAAASARFGDSTAMRFRSCPVPTSAYLQALQGIDGTHSVAARPLPYGQAGA
ncbi:MAG: hypothetical protein U1F15_05150 [Burkholderiales bacterium]